MPRLANLQAALRSTLTTQPYSRAAFPLFLLVLLVSAFLLNAMSLLVLLEDHQIVVNPLLAPEGYVFLFFFSLLATLALLLAWHRFDVEKHLNTRASAPSLAGFTAALFTSACPVCPSLALTLLGIPSAFTFLPFNGWELRLGSLALLALSLLFTASALVKAGACPARK